MARLALLLTLSVSALPLSGCATAYHKSLGTDTNQVFTRIYTTDFNTAWQAVREALKFMSIDVENRDSGVIQTRWQDNTEQKIFAESFGHTESVLNSKYRLKVSVFSGSLPTGKPAIQVAVQKDQLVQRDVLEGWRYIETDTVEENTLLYRIGRIIYIRMKIAKMEEEKIKRSLEDTKF